MTENKRLMEILLKAPKCPNCGSELPSYPCYMSDYLDSRGYSEVWICEECKKSFKREDIK